MHCLKLFHPRCLIQPLLVLAILLRVTTAVFFLTILSSPTAISLAADEPQPDPAGIATGDKLSLIHI